MKNTAHYCHRGLNKIRNQGRCRGIALVIVLALIVLITALVVGFLVRAGGERTASASYYATASTRQLADVAVNLVQAQINEATTSGPTNAWASQPGAVRVYDDQGRLTKIHRLYSAPTLVTAATPVDPSVLQEDVPPKDWDASPSLWVDLNAPVIVNSGNSAASGSSYSIYPILDPRDPNNPGTVEAPIVTSTMTGFSLSSVDTPVTSPLQPVPMPVRWLYVLRQGQIVAPEPSGKGVKVPGASGTNPIVGRIAFWTDDECAKVNINTAAGSLSKRPDPGKADYPNNLSILPAPWETPHFKIWDEMRLFSQNQPVHGEYQRYPGHPATTDLYNIFNALGVPMGDYPPNAMAQAPDYLTGGGGSSGYMAAPSDSTNPFFDLLSRYGNAYSSAGGTLNSTKIRTPTPVTVASNRLYSSVGELFYDANRNPNGIARQQLESAKFFLTAHSRAPDVNLFGAPRISMWPIDSAFGADPTPKNNTPLASIFDRLIAFCTTTGTGSNIKRYYVQRHDSTSPTNDYDGAGVPGSPGNGIGIPRNQDLYRYLQSLTSKQIPGFGGSFAAKYNKAGERDQILTEMVDYIRSTNVYDHSSTSSKGFTPAYSASFNGYGQVTPLKIGQTQGLGRMFTISEVGLHVICTADGNSPLAYVPPTSGSYGLTSPVKGSANDYRYVSNLPVAQYLKDINGKEVGLVQRDNVLLPATGAEKFPANPTLADKYLDAVQGVKPLPPLSPGQKRLQAMLIFELQCPMQGYDLIYPNLQVKVSNLESVSIGGQRPFTQIDPSDTPKNGILSSSKDRTNQWTNYGGYQQFSMPITRPKSAGGSNTRQNGWDAVANVGALTPPFFVVTGTARVTPDSNAYLFVSDPFTVHDDDVNPATLAISSDGSPIAIELQVVTPGGAITVQKFNVTFPSTNTPMPYLLQYGLQVKNTNSTSSFTAAGDWWGFDNRISWASQPISVANTVNSSLYLGCIMRSDPVGTLPTATAGKWTYMTNAVVPLPYYKDTNGNGGNYPPGDVVRTLIARDGDVRLVMAKSIVTADGYSDMTPTAGYNSGANLADNFVCDGAFYAAGADRAGKLVPGATYALNAAPKVPSNVTPDANWDWDTGQPSAIDGAYANKPDEGNIYVNDPNYSPYYQAGNNSLKQNELSSYFTANRIIPSPVMFGSLPTGVTENIPWRTLQFRPIKGGSYNHDSRLGVYEFSGQPPDHLLLDLFTMPVVEPYAISEPFSTAGRINMNYQIVPFTYITRDTGVRAVLGSELIARVPLKASSAPSGSAASYYKGGAGSSKLVTPPGTVPIARLPMNLDEDSGTLRQFKDKFDKWEIFKSPSEICDLFLVPEGYIWPGFDAIWYGDDFAMVGDNVRERPYGDIYPRLTTKSNTFTVHFRVQALKNPTSGDPAQWNEASGAVTGEYRGSTTLERYLDPSNSSIPDYAKDANPQSLETYYQWRTISNTSFTP